MAEEEITPTPVEVEAKVPKTSGPKENGLKARFKRLLDAYLSKKKLTIPLTVLAIIGVILAVPFTRYSVLGLAIKSDFTVIVMDESLQKPVSKAQVSIGGKTVETDAKGKAIVKVSVGNKTLKVTKKYFKDVSGTVLVPLNQKDDFRVFIAATGRQVPVVVTNKITGKPLSGAVLTAGEAEAKTDKDGKATVVVPAGKDKVEVKLTAGGYNDLKAELKVVETAVPENNFALTPSGKIYFLSKQSGKIDVVKTNLDGSERQIVLAGTGKEESGDTVLLASRDWKYLALKSKRDGGENAKLFLIEAGADKVTTMDEGNAYFGPVGWSDHKFVFTVGRKGKQNWEPKGQALKSFDAVSNKLTTIDETHGEGSGAYDYAFNLFSQIYILDNELVYNKSWQASYAGKLDGKTVSLASVRPDGSGKRSIKDFPVPGGYSYYSVDLRLYAPKELYVRVPAVDAGSKSTFHEYEHGKLAAKSDVTDEKFYDDYPTYLESPDGKQTFWGEPRDGKNTLFVGNDEGDDSKQVATLSEHQVYGWFTNDYLLVSKGSSELFIMPVAGGKPLKITDYHKPYNSFYGYGKGYGGL